MTMLIAYDGSAFGAELLRSARVVAEAARWPINVVAVEDEDEELRVVDDDPALEGLELHRVKGHVATAILDAAEHHEAHVIALGLRSYHDGGFGHVAEELLHRATVVLFVMRPSSQPLRVLRRILVPMEGSPQTSAAMQVADGALCAPGREIIMLHVVSDSTPAESGSMPAPRFMDHAHYDWNDWEREFQMRFARCPHGGRHRVLAQAGDIGDVIVARTQELEVDLVTITWKRRFEEGAARIAHKVLDECPCPVLIVGQQSVAEALPEAAASRLVVS